tara:strand:- start:192 stop:431 length:240 start_codon:yes stop_codon:yes gene_type:complete
MCGRGAPALGVIGVHGGNGGSGVGGGPGEGGGWLHLLVASASVQLGSSFGNSALTHARHFATLSVFQPLQYFANFCWHP